MATAIKMPQLGVTMTEARVVSWLKSEGDPVRKGEVVATIETDKITAEVTASADGVLRRIVAPEGTVVPVVGVMAVIGAKDEPDAAIDAAAGKQAAPSASAAAATKVPAVVTTATAVNTSETRATAAPVPASAAEVRASPIAKRLAMDLGVDLTRVQGSGPGSRIVEADVRAAAAAVERPAPEPAAQETNGFVRASPLARRLAREHGIELAAVRGTGPQGRVVERDVVAALTAPAAASAATNGLTPRETIPLDGIRRVIAARMWESLQQSAQLTLTTEADATALVELRSQLGPAARVYGHRPPSYNDLLVAIVSRALRQHPMLNSSLVQRGDRQDIVCWNEINVGLAVALDRGLLVPVLRNADQKPLQQISQELGELTERALENKLGVDELQGGTFTITNLGNMDVDAFTPIVNPPQCAILGVGRIVKKPAVFEDQVVTRQMVTLSLTFDHRIVDGKPAAGFLRDVKRSIEAGSLEG